MNVGKSKNEKISEIKEEWIEEVQKHFEKWNKIPPVQGRLDGPATWELVAIEKKYKKMLSEIEDEDTGK